MVDVVPQVGNVTRETSARPPRPTIPRRDWSIIQTLLRRHNITIEAVAKKAGLPKSTASRVLNFKHFYRCELINVARVRMAAEDLLMQANSRLCGEIEQADLWSDYDIRLMQVAA